MYYGKIYNKLVSKRIYNLNLIIGRNISSTDNILNVIENTGIKSVKDWTNVRKTILDHENNRGQFSRQNIDAVILSYCTRKKIFHLGSSYLDFLSAENIKPNLATLGKYLKLIYHKNELDCLESAKRCSDTEEKVIFKLYEDLRKEYPVFDSFTLENIILALSITSQWQKCLDLLQEIKVSAMPNNLVYSAIVAAAFLNKNEDLGWKLLEEMMENDKEPKSISFLAYLKLLKGMRKKEKAVEKLQRLFLFFQENNLKCNNDVAVSISDLMQKLGYNSSFTSVNYHGICRNCTTKLDKFDLNDEEFEELKVKLFENVIVGRDVFVKTNPQELDRFKQFVSNMGKFDVVLDGLNVAYSAGTKQSPHVLSALVASVVTYFAERRMEILLLGRAHMQGWPRQNWGYVTQNSTVFLTQNISQDDPYLLYCALNSGKETVIVTRDLMRGHKFLLRSPRHKMLFNRWLSQQQYQLLRVDNKRGPVFRIPPPYSIAAQKNHNIWHIPHEPEMPKDKNEFHKTWLCLHPK